LRAVSCNKGLHFYTVSGNYTGETATSLVYFGAILQVIGVESVNFHFKRGDFQNWSKDIIGDVELAEKIDRIELELIGENLRKELLGTVETCISELKIAHTYQSRLRHE